MRSVIPTATGSRGQNPEFYRGVLAAYREAEEAAPRSPYKYMRNAGLVHGSDSSVRRWVREAKRLEAEEASKPQQKAKR